MNLIEIHNELTNIRDYMDSQNALHGFSGITKMCDELEEQIQKHSHPEFSGNHLKDATNHYKKLCEFYGEWRSDIPRAISFWYENNPKV